MNFCINNWRAVEKLILKLLSAVCHHWQSVWCPSFSWCRTDTKTATESLWWLMHKQWAGMAFYFLYHLPAFLLIISHTKHLHGFALRKVPSCHSHLPLNQSGQHAKMQSLPPPGMSGGWSHNWGYFLLCWGSGKGCGNLDSAAHGRAWRSQLNLALSLRIWS